MEVIYGLIPMVLIFGFLVVIVFIWMAKTGHFDDLDGAANRIFMDDDYPEDSPKSEEFNKGKEAQNKEVPNKVPSSSSLSKED